MVKMDLKKYNQKHHQIFQESHLTLSTKTQYFR
jgi:hypothetical protein